MKPQRVFFTTKTAKGEKFCDRIAERALLKNNIEKGTHTVIVSPRRYGKTSLVDQVLHEMKVDHTSIDLFCTIYANAICEKITKGVSEIVRTLVPFTEKTLLLIQECFKNVFVGMRAGKFEIKMEFSKPRFNPANEIINVLQGLENIAKKQNRRVVVFIDEFQDLLKADFTDEIQAAFRSIAQKAEYLCFIFSGNSRTMLKEIFEDKNKPLYMLCQPMPLGRIPSNDFKLHIQNAAKTKWQTMLSEDLVDYILELTETHTYYVNLLCDKIWDNVALPTKKVIQNAWKSCLTEQQDKLIADLEPLNTNRTKVLSTIALLGKIKEPNSKFFTDNVGLSLSSIQKAILYLKNHDYTYNNNQGNLTLVDPLLKQFLCERLGAET